MIFKFQNYCVVGELYPEQRKNCRSQQNRPNLTNSYSLPPDPASQKSPMSDFDSNSPLPDVEDVCPQDFMMGRVEEDSRDLFNSLQPEHLAIDLHREPLYKSATLIAPAPAPDMFASHMEAVDFPMGCGMDFFPALQKPTLTKPSLLRDSKGVQSFRLDCIPFSCTIASVEATNPPEAPFLLMDSHFETNLLADDITQKINNMLQESTEVSFEHLPAAFEWNISYLSGSSHCKLQFHIYEGQTQAFIVEANRLNVSTVCIFKGFDLK